MTSNKVKVDLCLPEFSVTKIVTWEFHIGESAKGRNNMILGRDLLIPLGLYLKFSDHVIIGVNVTFGVFLAPMVYVINYDFTYLTDKKFQLE